MMRHPLSAGGVPSWANAWGEDRFGPWVELEVCEAIQRMRWMRPGTYRRGSPESEAGRFEWEGPQHDVTLTQGFWLGATPVTQALWTAVMGGNPSRFVDPNRPVEQVSWDDVQAFCQALAEQAPGLRPRLPTEAEWEWACRATTTTATWLGDLDIVEQNNAPLLDAIAWYGGNSGVEYDLDEFADSSGWPGKQYPHTRSGTRRVATKRPNPWGLYDMLGNVWEWCEDAGEYREPYSGESSVDPVSTTGVKRVFRGGGWGIDARYLRAASRHAYHPGDRFASLGFRLAGGPAPSGGAEEGAGDRPRARGTRGTGAADAE